MASYTQYDINSTVKIFALKLEFIQRKQIHERTRVTLFWNFIILDGLSARVYLVNLINEIREYIYCFRFNCWNFWPTNQKKKKQAESTLLLWNKTPSVSEQTNPTDFLYINQTLERNFIVSEPLSFQLFPLNQIVII